MFGPSSYCLVVNPEAVIVFIVIGQPIEIDE